MSFQAGFSAVVPAQDSPTLPIYQSRWFFAARYYRNPGGLQPVCGGPPQCHPTFLPWCQPRGVKCGPRACALAWRAARECVVTALLWMLFRAWASATAKDSPAAATLII